MGSSHSFFLTRRYRQNSSRKSLMSARTAVENLQESTAVARGCANMMRQYDRICGASGPCQRFSSQIPLERISPTKARRGRLDPRHNGERHLTEAIPASSESAALELRRQIRPTRYQPHQELQQSARIGVSGMPQQVRRQRELVPAGVTGGEAEHGRRGLLPLGQFADENTEQRLLESTPAACTAR
jgi:hypothetical protein